MMDACNAMSNTFNDDFKAWQQFVRNFREQSAQEEGSDIADESLKQLYHLILEIQKYAKATRTELDQVVPPEGGDLVWESNVEDFIDMIESNLTKSLENFQDILPPEMKFPVEHHHEHQHAHHKSLENPTEGAERLFNKYIHIRNQALVFWTSPRDL